MTEIKVFKTFEISDDLWQTIVEGFNICFPEHRRTVKQLVERYTVYPLGYSYHALYYQDGELVGYNGIIPALYSVRGEDALMGQSVDTYVLPQYRKDIFIFKKLYNRLQEVCLQDGFIVFLGVPNPNSYQYSVKLLKCKEIFQLDYWILPVNIGNIIGKMKWANCFSQLYACCTLGLNAILSFLLRFKENVKLVRIKTTDEYFKARLSAEKYTNKIIRNNQFSYTITEDEGIRCAYIMYAGDGERRTYRALYRCASYIYHNEKVDMIMFNGTMNMNQILLVKVPAKYQPRKLPFTVNFLSEEIEKKYSILLNPKDWDFTLINLDVR